MLIDVSNKLDQRFLHMVANCMYLLSDGMKEELIAEPAALKDFFAEMSLKNRGIYPLLSETSLLKPVVSATVPTRKEPIVLSEFFQTGTAIEVSATFADNFDLSEGQSEGSAPECPYVGLVLKANAYDQRIFKQLPLICLSRLEDIAGFIQVQPYGESGFLGGRSSYMPNVFYVKGRQEGLGHKILAVRVFGHQYANKWCIEESLIDKDFGFHQAGCRIFCPGYAILR